MLGINLERHRPPTRHPLREKNNLQSQLQSNQKLFQLLLQVQTLGPKRPHKINDLPRAKSGSKGVRAVVPKFSVLVPIGY